MRSTLDDLEFLTYVNSIYLSKKSLNKTVQWLEEEYGIKTNRISLSRMFHRANLEVQAPNGKPFKYLGEALREGYRSPEAELSAGWIELIFDDIRAYLSGEGSFINYLSACWAFASELYEKMLLTLQYDGPLYVDAEVLPDGISELQIMLGRDMYQTLTERWVASPGC